MKRLFPGVVTPGYNVGHAYGIGILGWEWLFPGFKLGVTKFVMPMALDISVGNRNPTKRNL